MILVGMYETLRLMTGNKKPTAVMLLFANCFSAYFGFHYVVYSTIYCSIFGYNC